MLIRIESEQAAAATTRLGRSLRPLHRNKAAAVAVVLVGLHVPLADFLEVALRMVNTVRCCATRERQRIPRSECRANGRRVVQPKQSPVIINASPEQFGSAGNQDEVDVAG